MCFLEKERCNSMRNTRFTMNMPFGELLIPPKNNLVLVYRRYLILFYILYITITILQQSKSSGEAGSTDSAIITYSLNQNGATQVGKEKGKVTKRCGLDVYLTWDLSKIQFEAAIELAKRSMKQFCFL